jgi:hypothetical protein
MAFNFTHFKSIVFKYKKLNLLYLLPSGKKQDKQLAARIRKIIARGYTVA